MSARLPVKGERNEMQRRCPVRADYGMGSTKESHECRLKTLDCGPLREPLAVEHIEQRLPVTVVQRLPTIREYSGVSHRR